MALRKIGARTEACTAERWLVVGYHKKEVKLEVSTDLHLLGVSAVIDKMGTGCLVDTGATVSILPIKSIRTVRLQLEHKQTNVRTVNGQKREIFGSMQVEVAMEDHRCCQHKFLSKRKDSTNLEC